MKKVIFNLSLTLAIFGLVFTSCSKEETTPKPTVSFSVDNDGGVVTFTATVTNATSYAWDFGDDETSTEQNPVHTYAEAGEYEVSCTVTGEGGSLKATGTLTISVEDMVAGGTNGKTWMIDPTKATIGTGLSNDDQKPFPGGFLTLIGLGDEYEDSFTLKASDKSISIDTKANGKAFASLLSVMWANQWDQAALMAAVAAGEVTLPHQPGEADPDPSMGICSFDYAPAAGTWELKHGDLEVTIAADGTKKTYADADYFELSTGMYLGLFDIAAEVIVEKAGANELVLTVFVHSAAPIPVDYVEDSLTFTFKRSE